MLLFRSEERVARWCDQRGIERGAVFDLQRMWQLAQRWYHDRLDLDWRRKSVDERQRILDEVGLTGAFWAIERR
jgi:hypothetical protein